MTSIANCFLMMIYDKHSISLTSIMMEFYLLKRFPSFLVVWINLIVLKKLKKWSEWSVKIAKKLYSKILKKLAKESFLPSLLFDSQILLREINKLYLKICNNLPWWIYSLRNFFSLKNNLELLIRVLRKRLQIKKQSKTKLSLY
jgi:hypothetical protein